MKLKNIGNSNTTFVKVKFMGKIGEPVKCAKFKYNIC